MKPLRPSSVVVEIRGLELSGIHGVEEREREQPQPFLFDLWLDVGEAGLSDRIDEAIDYRDVAACVRDISEARSFQLLEALAAAVADALLERFPLESVCVRVRKPDVRPAGFAVDYTAASVSRRRAPS